MTTKESSPKLGGLDIFRVAAAALVVAIHTSPLADVSAGADFFLTRILARTAVPFFLMVTGQFVLGKKGIWRHVKKLLLLYAGTILLYLPIGIYAGHFEEVGPCHVLKMLVFDGTFYHLWYFPACILGIGIICALERIFPHKLVLASCVVLYILGLLGDSYFGLLSYIPGAEAFYERIFTVSSYTRNGLFFAPVFLYLGKILGRNFLQKGFWTPLKNPRLCVATFSAFFGLMTAEGFILRFFALQRHDSMYIFLIPSMIFLYSWILAWQIRPRRRMRTLSAWVYILHPGMIVAVRGAAEILGFDSFLVENNLVHYAAVLTGSFASAAAAMAVFALAKPPRPYPGARAWIELDREALGENVRTLQKSLPQGCRLMPAVKADAYGHGAVLIARQLNGLGVKAFCVASAAEGAELRKNGIKGEILVLGYTHPEDLALIIRYRLIQTVVDTEYGRLLEKHLNRSVAVHIAVDTGMHRLGVPYDDIEAFREIYGRRKLKIQGIFTHLCADDTNRPQDRKYTQMQAERFYRTVEGLRREGFPCSSIHISASYGILNYPELQGDYARVGIALYGVLSTKKDGLASRLPLKPVLSLKARVAAVKKLSPGEAAGYGLCFVAERETTIAILTIGYADGLPRALSCQNGAVLINGCRASVIGRICMDQTIVDVSGISHVRPGDVAVLIGKSGEEEITAGDLALQADTITNEVLSRLGRRLERVML